MGSSVAEIRASSFTHTWGSGGSSSGGSGSAARMNSANASGLSSCQTQDVDVTRPVPARLVQRIEAEEDALGRLLGAGTGQRLQQGGVTNGAAELLLVIVGD